MNEEMFAIAKKIGKTRVRIKDAKDLGDLQSFVNAKDDMDKFLAEYSAAEERQKLEEKEHELRQLGNRIKIIEARKKEAKENGDISTELASEQLAKELRFESAELWKNIQNTKSAQLSGNSVAVEGVTHTHSAGI